MHHNKTSADLQNAALGRRFAAMFYDFLLLIAIILVAVSLFTMPVDLIFGDNTANQLLENPLFKLLYQLYLLLVAAAFYVGFWVHGGQTLGMKVWHLRLVNSNAATVSTGQAIRRLLLAGITIAPLGLGFFWMLFDRERQTLYDRWSDSRVIHQR
ncbi:MAG: RDD family protein [Chromatiales bacterium]|jgi:uncharacterized RDD family membrane protein YckC